MGNYFLKKQDIPKLISLAESDYSVYAPVKDKEHYIFSRITDPGAIVLDHRETTMLPPSKILTKSRETVIRFPAGDDTTVRYPVLERTFILGARPCDLEGLALLDQIFSEPISDVFYAEKRARSFIVGLKCRDVCDSFKQTQAASDAPYAYDLMLEDKGDKFLVSVGSDKGQEFVEDKRFSALFEATDEPEGPAAPCHREAPFASAEMAAAIESSRSEEVWQEVADICFGCGICSYVCPLCYCFETDNKIDIEGNIKCNRRWDSCFLPNFFRVAGHDFRPELKDRLFNWYHHKFVRAMDERGRPDCVGCGRCVRYCPAKIDFTEVLEKVKPTTTENS